MTPAELRLSADNEWTCAYCGRPTTDVVMTDRLGIRVCSTHAVQAREGVLPTLPRPRRAGELG